jgi:hypothetical protein
MKKYLLGTLALAALVAAPAGAALADMFAYVNQDGEVRTVEAGDPNTAIVTAPSIDEHSGVIKIDSASDSIVGDDVSGV